MYAGRQRALVWLGHCRWSFDTHGARSDWLCDANFAPGDQGNEGLGEAIGQTEGSTVSLETQSAEHR